jgi:catechol 2,3-dioxygenase-like lactoylglutathione lyase family enzyme
MIVGIHHVALSVPDIEAANAFYTSVFGFTSGGVSSWDGDLPEADAIIGIRGTAARACMLTGHNICIELWEYRNPRPNPLDPAYPPSDHGIAHFCFQVNDIHAEHARLTAAGMRFVGPPQKHGPVTAVYGRDPFGHIIEILQVDGA